jgi:hypothetical protein
MSCIHVVIVYLCTRTCTLLNKDLLRSSLLRSVNFAVFTVEHNCPSRWRVVILQNILYVHTVPWSPAPTPVTRNGRTDCRVGGGGLQSSPPAIRQQAVSSKHHAFHQKPPHIYIQGKGKTLESVSGTSPTRSGSGSDLYN